VTFIRQKGLGIPSVGDTDEMEFRSELTDLAKIIQVGRLTHAEITKLAGSSRTRITAVANGNTHGVSTDVLIRVPVATAFLIDHRIERVAGPKAIRASHW